MEKLKNIIDLFYVACKVVDYGLRVIDSKTEGAIPKNHEMAREYYQAILDHLNITVEVESNNLENLINPPAIIIGNHTTHFDILTLAVSLGKHPVIFMAKKSLFKYPFLRKGMRELGMIKRDRSHLKETMRNLEKGVYKAKSDKHYLVMYPEGTRTTLENYDMLPFDRGPFFTSVKYGLPIILVASHGGQEILPRNTSETKPGTMRLKILEPMYPKEYSGTKKEKINQMMEVARSRLTQGIDSLRPPKKQTS